MLPLTMATEKRVGIENEAGAEPVIGHSNGFRGLHKLR